MKNKKVVFIGLGTMGYHMAGHLSHFPAVNLVVWNRSVHKSHKWQEEFKGNVVFNLKQAVEEADVVITCTGKDEDMAEILFSEKGVYDYLKKNTVFIDHTTTSYVLAQKLQHKLKKKNIDFLDAPISGGEIGAINATLSVMIGGDESILKKVKPIINCYAKTITYIGKNGAGQLAKMANQICIAGILQGLSEALRFAEAEKIDIEKLLTAISGGAAQSWQMENRAQTMHERSFDFGFAIKWMVKDLGYCLNQAKTNKTNLSLSQKVYDKYRHLMQTGKENKDTSALILFDDKINSKILMRY